MRFWYQRSMIAHLLRPLSMCYHTGVQLRRAAYQRELLQVTQFPVPIVVVGNITVGGTGKTPTVIALTKHLQQRGYKPGIVSRGYKAKCNNFPKSVEQGDDPVEVGDEPILIARMTGVPVVIDPNRVRAVDSLLNRWNCDVILSDDGLQHYALRRDIEIAIIDGDKRFGNELCLPAGPLREPMTRLKTVDWLLANGTAAKGEFELKFKTNAIFQLIDSKKTLNVSKMQVHAVAGIGNPARFFQQLRLQGFDVIEHPFPDHHPFKAKDIDFGENTTVIMTAKDAVKCEKFADERHWCQPVEAHFESPFLEAFVNKLDSVQCSLDAAKRSQG